MAYSVAGRFPSYDLCRIAGIISTEETDEDFNNRSYREQWKLSLKALREKYRSRLNIRQNDWEKYYFTHSKSFFDIMYDWDTNNKENTNA